VAEPASEKLREAISVVILAKNEEALIARCIAGVRWADEVVVVDSGSTDRTREIALAAGAVVHQQAWLGFAAQRNRAIELASHDWIFEVDADELVTPELARAILDVLASSPRPEDGYAVDRRDELFGKLLPDVRREEMRRTFVRLYNRTCSRYDPAVTVHERVVYPGQAIMLPGLLLHWRNVGFIEQLHKDADYAALEAEMLARAGGKADPARLILWPLFRFLWIYFWCGSWRVGSVGLIYALMRAHAEFLRRVALWEKQHATRSLHPPETVWRPLPGKGAQGRLAASAPRAVVGE
jgi:glycosyltransferase involved in cell wall biosynthesis